MANQIIINSQTCKGTIHKNIYGHFAEHLGRCVYEGIYVGEDSDIPNIRGMRLDVIEALRKIRVPVLRWPGGCFADEYHWRDGIGPKAGRPSMINTHWGGTVENNAFGTHEFFDFCELIGAEPYISGNLGSGDIREMSEWVEYMTSDSDTPITRLRRQNGREKPWKLKYFGVGNENWGCGGRMRAEYCADIVSRYNLYCRDYGENKLYRIACGPRREFYKWTDIIMRDSSMFFDAISLHDYTLIEDPVTVQLLPDGNERYINDVNHAVTNRGSATEFTEYHWFATLKNALKIDQVIARHCAIMDQYDPEKRVALAVDEWGNWFDVAPGDNPGFLYQQNTLRDALSAASTLNIFNHHCDRVRMANIAQMINVLQAVILTEGQKMVLTPTYHIFDMYKCHQDAQLLESALLSDAYTYEGEKLPKINASASKNKEGVIHITLCNIDPHKAAEVLCYVEDSHVLGHITGTILTAKTMQAMNTFEEPDTVKPAPFTGFTVDGAALRIQMPAKSVILLEITEA